MSVGQVFALGWVQLRMADQLLEVYSFCGEFNWLSEIGGFR
eukprot:gene43-1931_t